MIGPRSGHNRATIVILELGRPSSNPVGVIPRQKLRDRSSIAPRSRFDRTAIVEFFHDTSAPSDGLQLDERSGFTDLVRRNHDSSPPPAVRS